MFSFKWPMNSDHFSIKIVTGDILENKILYIIKMNILVPRNTTTVSVKIRLINATASLYIK